MKDRILAELERLLSELRVCDSLKKVVIYALTPPGKMIRPRLALACCSDLGGDSSVIIREVLALEIIHVASLIHDDLPALDNDELRRGKPTVHRAFGESQALLAGDFLIPFAFRCVSAGCVEQSTKMGMINALARAFEAVCEGQILDMQPIVERTETAMVHRLKTGALFAAAAEFGALQASKNSRVIDQFRVMGEHLGLFFQITDDYLDCFGDLARLGKGVGSDKRNNKQTFFSTVSLGEAKSILAVQRERLEEIVCACERETGGRPLTNVRGIVQEIVGRCFD